MKPEHVVKRPRPPFRSQDGGLEVHQVPSWKDNLVWVLRCVQTDECAIVDGPEAEGALALIDDNGWRLTTVFNTHTHPDHVGVNRDLQKRPGPDGGTRLDGLVVIGPAGDAERVPGLTRGVTEGDTVKVGVCEGRVMLTEGHIRGHVSYVFDDLLFCGDTMFGGGCGYLFDGPPEAMHDSLLRLAALPDDTKVCCAHEYTEDNLRFAMSIDSDNEALRQRVQKVLALRGRGECSVPSSIAEERATNPFLRHTDEGIQRRVGDAMAQPLADAPPATVFAATRALKDRKDYKEGAWPPVAKG